MITSINSGMANFPFLLNNVSKDLASYLEQISTGRTINRASDSPSGYAQSKLLERDMRIAERKALNAERAQVYVENSSSNINSIVDTMALMEDLALQSQSGILSDQERDALNMEFNQMKEMLSEQLSDLPSNIYDGTQASGVNINLNGTGVDGSKNTLESLSLNNIEIASVQSAESALGALTGSSMQMLNENMNLGSTSRRLGIVEQSSQNNAININASLSVLRDADLISAQINKANIEIIKETILKSAADAIQSGQNINSLI